ncbi:MAG: response regulator [Planctomycetes bacterium]|nr:response regulator [Planctomycetota bacterium]
MLPGPLLQRSPAILAVDDSVADIRLLREALQERSVKADLLVAENAVQGYDALGRRGRWQQCPPIELILLDLNLPVISGYEFLRVIGEDEAWARIPLVVVTSSRAANDRYRCARLGACAFVTKPATYSGYLGLADHVKLALAAGDVAHVGW